MSLREDFYSKKSALGVPNALVLLMLVFFFVPFAFRGARMALQKTENNVKDWLPSDFRETEELAWFAKNFVSEQFIIATWDGCEEEDQRLKMFVSKLRQELEPGPNVDPKSEYFAARDLGGQYGLFAPEDYNFNWGGKNEKWLVDGNGRHFYVTPNGRLYRWGGNSNMVSAAFRSVTRATGSFELEGQFVAGFGDPGTDGAPNPFWANPRLLTAPLFKSVETGPDLVAQLTKKDGALHNSTEPKAGERDAIARLTGTMFGPPVPGDFDWTADSLEQELSREKLAELPEDWKSIWDLVLERELADRFEGSLEKLLAVDPVEQSEVWYAFFDAVAVEEPTRQTCVILTLTDAARGNLGKVIARGMLGQTQGRVLQIAKECGIAPPPTPSMAPPPFNMLAGTPSIPEPIIHLGGPPVDNVAIDEEGTITLVRLIGYSLILGLVLSWILLRSTRLMMMVFFVGGVSAVASLGMVWWSNASIDAILLTMPSLVYVLGMAGAIHIVNYYRDAAIENGQADAPGRAIAHAVMPCTLAALTTAIGLASLCSSNILPIRKFGIFSAMGVMATLVLLYTFLPSALSIFPPPMKAIREAGDKSAAGILRFWEAIGRFVLKNHWYVNSACILAFIALGFGLFRIKTDVQLLKLFDSKAQIIQDYAWLEDNFGRLVPMELVVRFPTELQKPVEAPDGSTDEDRRGYRTQLSLLERAEAVGRIQEVLQDRFGYAGLNIVGRGMSPVTLLKDIPDPWPGFSPHRSGYNRKFHEDKDQLLETDYLAMETQGEAAGTELWRISLRLGALNDIDYGDFVSSLRAAVEPVVAAYRCRQEAYEAIVSRETFDVADKTPSNVLVLGFNPKTMLKKAAFEDGRLAMDAKTEFALALRKVFISETTNPPSWYHPDYKEPEIEDLESSSCIVIMGDHPDYDWDAIRAIQPNIIDARPMIAEASFVQTGNRLPEDQPVELTKRPGEMDVVYTGIVPVVYKAQRTLLVSLIESTAWAFVLIAIVMTCLLSPARSFGQFFVPSNFVRGLGSGAVSMIPNVFPVVIIFGFIGWSDQLIGQRILVDIGTMMTASVAMGVAVDDTIHFLTWFREGLKRGLDRREAIFVAYKHVAPAMTQTTIIAGLGLSVFALSTFTPTQRFGKLMLTLLGAALVGDLIFLPALLASPLGRIFTMLPSKDISADQGQSTPVLLEAGGTMAIDETPPGFSDGASDDEDSEYRLAELDEREAAKQADDPPAASDEVPQLQIRRPQMMRERPIKARRRQS
ncbi:MAG: RND family transporter [Pirellulaceae bacterium]